MMVGKLLSFWDDNFSGAMLNFQGVPSREVTYPTLAKGKSSLEVPLGGHLLITRRIGIGIFIHFPLPDRAAVLPND